MALRLDYNLTGSGCASRDRGMSELKKQAMAVQF